MCTLGFIRLYGITCFGSSLLKKGYSLAFFVYHYYYDNNTSPTH